jgi:hypothetical protein
VVVLEPQGKTVRLVLTERVPLFISKEELSCESRR